MSFNTPLFRVRIPCLNPYSTGRYSMRYGCNRKCYKRCSLNPYSTGRYSMRISENEVVLISEIVLILILLEDTL